jgi:hypothetical protein
VISPGPAFVAGPFAAFYLMHMHNAQAACLTERGQVSNDCERTAGGHESSVFASRVPLPPAQVRPATVADDSAVGYGYHVRVIEPARAAEFGEVRDRGCVLSARVDKAIVAFDIVTFAYAVLMRPSLV